MGSSNSVWVVVCGEKCEGGSVEAVCKSELGARKYVETNVEYHFEPWKETRKNYWESGCDFVKIEEHKVLHIYNINGKKRS